MDELAGQRVTVMGLGRFGGGVGVTQFLAAQGCDVIVTDRAPAAKLSESIEQIRDLVDAGTVTLRLGEHNVSDFTTCDFVVASPAVPKPWENRFLRAAEAASIRITTEIGLVIERLPSRERVIGVTGSAGKSTTAAMIAHAMNSPEYRVHLGGNIGGSLLGTIDEIDAKDLVVLELSSAMLHWIEDWSPGVAVVTNLSENHIDWHGSMEHYLRCKQQLLASQKSGDVAVFGEENMPFTPNKGVREIGSTEDLESMQGTTLCLPGEHNKRNAVLAACAVDATTEIAFDDAHQSIELFKGLPHRLEFVGVLAGVCVYNDSKSTTPESAIMAIDATEDRGPIHLIAGGYDKGANFDVLAERCRSCARVWTIGATGDAMAKLIGPIAQPCGDLATAVEGAMSEANAGDVVLLSPACASWDQFDNFEERGERFVAAVKQWACVHQGESPC